jgi:hypothetical protein
MSKEAGLTGSVTISTVSPYVRILHGPQIQINATTYSRDIDAAFRAVRFQETTYSRPPCPGHVKED